MRISAALARSAASASGAALAATFGTVARLRPAAKPLHPCGAVFPGTLHRHGSTAGWDVPWLDEPGRDPVLVRFSRAVGLPAAVPDILGLTVRIERSAGPADLLLATTGTGRLSRFVLVPRNAPAAEYGSLMAYRTPNGPLWFFAHCPPEDPTPRQIQLSTMDRAGHRRPFGEIVLGAGGSGEDPVISFDPVVNPLPGLELYPWERRLREGAYSAARSSRE